MMLHNITGMAHLKVMPRSSNGVFCLQVFPPTPCMHLLSPTWATWHANRILLYTITRTIFGEEYRSWRSSLSKMLHSPVTSSLLGPNIVLGTPFPIHPQHTFLPQCERQSSTPMYSIYQRVPVCNASSPSVSKLGKIFPFDFATYISFCTKHRCIF